MNTLQKLQRNIALRQAILQGSGVVGGCGGMMRQRKRRVPTRIGAARPTGMGTRAGATKNPWLAHVKAFRAKHPNMPYSECLKRARASYKPVGGRVAPKRKAPTRRVARR